MTESHDPLHKLDSKNPWHIDDQFSKQYNRPGPRAVIENQWRIFGNVIEKFFNNSSIGTSLTLARILNAGCGDGINLLGINNIAQKRSWNVSIYGSDYNPLRLERAAKFSFVKETIQSPFLHHKIIEFAATLPISYKVKGQRNSLFNKPILKYLACDYLKNEDVYIQKYGYGYGYGYFINS